MGRLAASVPRQVNNSAPSLTTSRVATAWKRGNASARKSRNASAACASGGSSGAETVGMLGARVHTNDGITFALGVSYDNNQAWLVRPGITLKLR